MKELTFIKGYRFGTSFAKTSGTVTRDREKNWPIADQ